MKTPAASHPVPTTATGSAGAATARPQTTGRDRATGLPIIDSVDLLQGRSQVLIRHLTEIYRLQTTRQGKLILTK